MHKNKLTQSKTSLRQKLALVLFGLFLFLVILETGLRLGGFIISSFQEHRNSISMAKKGAYRIMCLGESTTVLPPGKDSYPSQLEEILNQCNTGISFSVINRGKGSIKTTYILDVLINNLNKYKPDMVITMMGINDGGMHLPYGDNLISKNKTFLKSLRLYKLYSLIWLHLLTKMEEMGIYKGYLHNKERIYQRAIEANPKNDTAYKGLGRLYIKTGRYVKAEEIYRKAIEANPKNVQTHLRLAWFYNRAGRYEQAEAVFKKAIELDTDNYRAYIGLGLCYSNTRRNDQAEDSYKKAMELNPKKEAAYIELGRYYNRMKKYSQAEEMFKKAIELNPGNYLAYVGLGVSYAYTKRYSQAEEAFKKAIKIDPKNVLAYGSLETLYREESRNGLSKEDNEKEKDLYFGSASTQNYRYGSITIQNYQKLKRILGARGIKLVCVQYPVRSVEPLKRIFQGEAGVIFVDNEKVFKDALKKSKNAEYFTDIFGGDFGHCTREGNRILATNIARVILKEYFYK